MAQRSVVADLRVVLDGMGQLVQQVRPEQWTDPTPCEDWDVRHLLNHVVFGNRTFAGILAGQAPPPQDRIRHMRDEDHLGGDPVRAWRESSADLLAAYDDPAVLGRTFRSPLGEMPGAGLAQLRITEHLVHGWDLARATDQDVPFPDEIAQATLDFTLHQLPPGASRSSFPFAPEQQVQPDAPAIDRLAAHLGRRQDTG